MRPKGWNKYVCFYNYKILVFVVEKIYCVHAHVIILKCVEDVAIWLKRPKMIILMIWSGMKYMGFVY